MNPLLISALGFAVSAAAFASLAFSYRRNAAKLRRQLAISQFDHGVSEIHLSAARETIRIISAERDAFAQTYTDLKSRAYVRNARGQLGRASDILDA